LNFGAVGTFSPLNILSAPTFLPLDGQPYFGPNTLFTKPQELPVLQKISSDTIKKRFLRFFIGYRLDNLNLQKRTIICNEDGHNLDENE
jgi:L-2-hydroxyglutarate oxidase LhgO